jgi:NAD(P)-dependent dehydrogenase (short-subunit alcohol dehydrogenase family)
MHETNGRLAGKVAIVTGAGRGIGSRVAKALAADGARVALASRSEGPLEEVAAEIRRHGGDALPLVCDVGVRADVDRAVATTADTYGRIDILVNNAQSWGPPGANAVAPPSAVAGRPGMVDYGANKEAIRGPDQESRPRVGAIWDQRQRDLPGRRDRRAS